MPHDIIVHAIIVAQQRRTVKAKKEFLVISFLLKFFSVQKQNIEIDILSALWYNHSVITKARALPVHQREAPFVIATEYKRGVKDNDADRYTAGRGAVFRSHL